MSPFSLLTVPSQWTFPPLYTVVLILTCLAAGLGADRTFPSEVTAPSTKLSSATEDDPIPTPPQRPSPVATPTTSPPIVIGPIVAPQANPTAPAKPVNPARQEIVALARTAMTYRQSGHLAEAIAQYQKAIARAKEALPKDDSDLGMLMGGLGQVYYESKQLDQAVSQFRGSLAILGQHLPRQDPNVTFVVNELARSLSDARRYEESARLNAENLKVREASLGKDHPATLLSLHNLGIDLAMLDRWPEAIEAFETAMERRKARGVVQSRVPAIDLEYLGDGHKALGHADKAEQYYLQALKASETPSSKGSEATIRVLQKLAIFYTGSQEYFPKAQEYGQRAIDLCRQVSGSNSAKTAQTLGIVGAAYCSAGKQAEAAPLLREAIAIYKSVGAGDSEETWRLVS